MASHNPSDLSQRSIAELIRGGDWAGAEGFEDTLAAIARQLAAQLRPEQRREFQEVARLCGSDMAAATAHWVAATAPVRTDGRDTTPPHPPR